MGQAPTPDRTSSLAGSLGADAVAVLVDALWRSPVPLTLYDRSLRITRANPAQARLLGMALEDLPGLTLEQTAPEIGRQVLPFLRRALETGQAQMNVEVAGETRGRPGERRFFLGNIYPFAGAHGVVEGLCVVVLEITEIRRREQEATQARAAAERAAERLNRLQDLTAALSAALREAEVAAVLLERGLPLLGACCGELAVLLDESPEPQLEVIAATDAASPAPPPARRIALAARAPEAEAVRTRVPVWVHSPAELARRCPRAATEAAEVTTGSAEAALRGCQAWVSAPLFAGERVLGVLGLGFRAPQPFGPDQTRTILAVAELGAQALERSRLHELERTLRSQAQQAAATLDAWLHASPSAIALLDDEVRVERVNPAFAELVGRAPESLIGEALPSPPAEEIATALAEAVQLMRARGEPVRGLALSAEAPPESGRRRHLLANTFPVRAPAGRTLGFGAILTDVTPLREAEAERERLVLQLTQALRERDMTAALLDSLYQAAPSGLALLDREMRFVRMNAAAAQLFGLRSEAQSGEPMQKLLPSMWAALGRELESVLQTGEARQAVRFSGETPARPGQRKHFDASLVPVRVQGAITAVGIIFRDVTDAKSAEIFQRYVLGIVGHDLRNPLSAIHSAIGYLLRATNLTDRQTSLLQRAQSSGVRMEHLIRDLLDFTRLSAGNGVPIAPQETSLDAVCRPLLDEMEAANPKRVIAYETFGKGRGRWDPDRLGQAVANLLTNALKYAPADSPVMLRWRDEGDGGVCLEVENYGPPIPVTMMPLLFEPFARAAAQEGRKPGVGLGLYITRQLVRAHGGTVECRSAPGGTCFAISLPREAPEPPQERELEMS